MSNSPLDLGAAHAACLNEALRQAPLIIDLWRSEVSIALNERYTSSLQNIEKRHLNAAMVGLQKHQVAIAKSFVAALTKTIANASQAAPGNKTEKLRSLPLSTSFDDLELMGDNAVQDSVDSARVLQTVATACDAGLAAFSARLSTTQGFAQVKTDKNPLRPEIFSRALLEAVQSIPVDNAIRSLWFTYGGALMGQLVQTLYMALNQLLIERGIAPAAYRVITNQGGKTVGQSNIASPLAASDGDSLGTSAFAPLAPESVELPTIAFPQPEAKRNEASVITPSQSSLNVNRLRRQLLGGNDASFSKQALSAESEPIVHQDFSHTLPASTAMLNEAEQHATAPSGARGKARNRLALPLAQLREQLSLEAKSLGRVAAFEAVSMMIEKIASDPRQLVPVQQVIVNAEPAFLRLAINDPSFFSDKSHPGRNLLETIASTSLAFASEAAPGFAEFLQDLQDLGAQLAAGGPSDTQHFVKLLAGFDKRNKLRHAAEYESRRGTTQALLEAEQLNILAKKISAEIRTRPDFALDNPTIQLFLTGPWAQVLAKERLAVDSDKTGMVKAIFSLTLGELLWSLNAEQTTPHPKRLAKLIPSILERLQGGLLSIDSPLAESQAFFEEVSAIHQSSLNSRRAPVEANTRQATSPRSRKNKSELDRLFGVGDPVYELETGPAPLLAQRSGSTRNAEPNTKPRFQQTQPFVETAPGEKPAPEAEAINSGGIELRLGAWVELNEDDQWLRAQLTWISRYKTLFIFTSAGGRTHSMTEPLLQFFLLQGQLKVISQEGVVSGTPD